MVQAHGGLGLCHDTALSQMLMWSVYMCNGAGTRQARAVSRHCAVSDVDMECVHV